MDWPSAATVIGFLARSSLVLFVGLLLSRVFQRDVRFRDYLWPVAFVAILILLVPLPAIRLPLVERASPIPPISSEAYELRPNFGRQPAQAGGDPGPSAILILAVGAGLIGLAGLGGQLIQSWRLVKGSEQATDAELVNLVYEVSERAQLSDPPIVALTDQVDSPCVVGFLIPILVLPAKLANSLATRDLRLVIRHEIGHINRRDSWRLVVLSFIRAVLWWNPLAWAGYKNAIRSMEEANDDRPVADSNDRAAYARLLAGSVGPVWAASSLKFFGQGNVLTRVRTLAEAGKRPTSHASFASLLVFLPILLPFDLHKASTMDPNRLGYDEVVFRARTPSSFALFRMKSDGSGTARMADTFKGAATPSVSPDGSRVAYVKGDAEDDQDIYVANLDGSGERKVVATPARDYLPAWSPDGKRLTFSTKATGTWNIGVADLETGEYRLITNDRKGNLESTWHPNGRRLVFSSHRTGVQKLWSIDVDGSNLVQLTFGDPEDTCAKYSRDGRFLVFASYRRWKYDVYLMDLTTRHMLPLTRQWQLDCGEPRFVDGDQSVVYSRRVGLDSRIGKVSLDGIDQTVLNEVESGWPCTR